MQIIAPPVMNPAQKERNADCSNFLNRFNSILFPASPFADYCLSGGRKKGFQAKHLSMKDVIKMSYLNTGVLQARVAEYKHSLSPRRALSECRMFVNYFPKAQLLPSEFELAWLVLPDLALTWTGWVQKFSKNLRAVGFAAGLETAQENNRRREAMGNI